MKTEIVIDTLKEWVNAANPGFVTHDDLNRVEARLDELLELVSTLQARLTPQNDGKRPRRRP